MRSWSRARPIFACNCRARSHVTGAWTRTVSCLSSSRFFRTRVEAAIPVMVRARSTAFPNQSLNRIIRTVLERESGVASQMRKTRLMPFAMPAAAGSSAPRFWGETLGARTRIDGRPHRLAWGFPPWCPDRGPRGTSASRFYRKDETRLDISSATGSRLVAEIPGRNPTARWSRPMGSPWRTVETINRAVMRVTTRVNRSEYSFEIF